LGGFRVKTHVTPALLLDGDETQPGGEQRRHHFDYRRRCLAAKANETVASRHDRADERAADEARGDERENEKEQPPEGPKPAGGCENQSSRIDQLKSRSFAALRMTALRSG